MAPEQDLFYKRRVSFLDRLPPYGGGCGSAEHLIFYAQPEQVLLRISSFENGKTGAVANFCPLCYTLAYGFSCHRTTVLGKKVNALRREGIIPAELYGHGVPNVHLSVSAKDFAKDICGGRREHGDHACRGKGKDARHHSTMLNGIIFRENRRPSISIR